MDITDRYDAKFTSPETDREIHVQGTLRSKSCHRYSVTGPSREDVALKCRGILSIHQVYMQLCRLAEGNEQAATTRADYLSTEMLLERYRKMAIEKRSLEVQMLQLSTALAACRAKANKTLTQRLNLFASQGAVGAIATELRRAHDAGKLEDNDSMLTFIADLVKSLRLGDNKNMRWTPSSHKIFQVLLKLGGPRTFLMFRSTLAAPDIRTVQKRWARRPNCTSNWALIVMS
jgi:hypothetical protein